VTYIFMVIHYASPEHRDDLIRGMVERAELMASTPDLIDAGPGEAEDDQRIAGSSRCESKEAFLAIPPGFGVPTSDVDDWGCDRANSSTSRACHGATRPPASR
jgi:hypothetical protein